ncbi:Gfo/Idh/MocA family oxidoreductase [Agromyces protaetiae]|uniref:Gfo/Idh/MocA family oxidoreductase n=1 Tax=Agromyces protaetiae TaxID=2509455 RepID=A0A4P6FJZ0_9MICO|nr:Gfo/Idh/MocA family oxidoreductase [Agromyces protaetiae]
MRVGVLGVGAVAQAVHLPLLQRRPDLFEIAALCDLSAELVDLMGDRFGVAPARRFTDFEAMLDAGGLDAVMILSRGSHAEPVLQAWRAGLPVFCEKPLAYTTTEVDALIEAERAAAAGGGAPGILLGYMKQYDPAVVAASELVAELDDVRSVEVTVLHPPSAPQLAIAHIVTPSSPPPADVVAAQEAEDDRLRRIAVGDADLDVWRTYRVPLVGSLAHDLSVMRSLGTIPASVDHADVWRQTSATQVRDISRDKRSMGEIPPQVAASGVLGNGGRFRLAWHYLPDFPAYRETVRVIHGGGILELVFPSPYLLHAPTELTVSTLDDGAERRVIRRSVAEAFEVQLERFAAMVTDGVPPESGLAGGRADIVDCQRIIAAWTGPRGIEVGGEIGARVLQAASAVR